MPKFPKKEDERMGKKGSEERKTSKDTHTHKDTPKQKKKRRETGKRKDPKEGRTMERTTN